MQDKGVGIIADLHLVVGQADSAPALVSIRALYASHLRFVLESPLSRSREVAEILYAVKRDVSRVCAVRSLFQTGMLSWRS